MDGNDFIALAGKLAAAPDPDEATCRTAISRAYYGAFHVAHSFLVELGFEPVRNANVHAFVRHQLSGSGHADAILASELLDDLQSARNRADYRLDDPQFGSRRDAMLIVERAHLVVSAVERCCAVEARETIRQGIIAYEQKIRPR
jgi:uncharacterized protein (UPF0332 family)